MCTQDQSSKISSAATESQIRSLIDKPDHSESDTQKRLVNTRKSSLRVTSVATESQIRSLIDKPDHSESDTQKRLVNTRKSSLRVTSVLSTSSTSSMVDVATMDRHEGYIKKSSRNGKVPLTVTRAAALVKTGVGRNRSADSTLNNAYNETSRRKERKTTNSPVSRIGL
jgi:hypothetical protein